MLTRWRDDHAARFGNVEPDHGLLVRDDGQPINRQSISQGFDRAVVRTGLLRLILHGWRHTHATLLLKSRVPLKVVSERLGHATPAFTMATYQHVLPGMQAEAAATFASLLDQAIPSGSTGPGR